MVEGKTVSSGTKRKVPPRDKAKQPSTSYDPGAETTRAPWPRPDGTVMDGPKVQTIPRMTVADIQRISGYATRTQGYSWDSWNSCFYNGLLRIEMAPTKFVDAGTLQKMGIMEDVSGMLTNMGIGHFASKKYPLYPELVRQFLASAELYYEDPENPRATQGTLTFLSSGLLYEVSIRELCGIYKFDKTPEGCSFLPWEDCKELGKLWGLIGKGGSWLSREYKITLIRNPVLRIVAKILGHTFWAKEETGSLRFDELIMIHYGLPVFAHSIYTEPPPAICGTNLGAVFASILVQRKFRALNTSRRKVESIGSLLTPIFMHCGIDLTQTERIDRRDHIDEAYLKNSQIFFPGGLYRFTTREGSLRHCKLPNPAITSLTSIQNIEFTPGEEHLTEQVATRRQRGSSSRSQSAQQEDAPIPEQGQPSFSEGDGREYIIPPYAGQYDLPPLPADTSDDARWRWQEQCNANMHSMLKKMWNAIAKIQCPRPPSCFRDSGTDSVPDCTDLVIYGQGTTGYSVEEPDSDPGERLTRRRRPTGASRSASSESEHPSD